jgi:hypothetical protein
MKSKKNHSDEGWLESQRGNLDSSTKKQDGARESVRFPTSN